MGKIKGWKKYSLIQDSEGTKEETYYNLPLQISIVKWNQKQLHFPNTSVFIYNNSKQIDRKIFKNYKEAKKFAMNYMRSNPNG